jgi:hypothetical protein
MSVEIWCVHLAVENHGTLELGVRENKVPNKVFFLALSKGKMF